MALVIYKYLVVVVVVAMQIWRIHHMSATRWNTGATTHLEYCCQIWNPKDMHVQSIEVVHRPAPKLAKGTKQSNFRHRLYFLRLVRLDKRCVWNFLRLWVASMKFGAVVLWPWLAVKQNIIRSKKTVLLASCRQKKTKFWQNKMPNIELLSHCNIKHWFQINLSWSFSSHAVKPKLVF